MIHSFHVRSQNFLILHNLEECLVRHVIRNAFHFTNSIIFFFVNEKILKKKNRKQNNQNNRMTLIK